MANEKVGFIGLGIMGKPMALNLIEAGYSLNVLEKNSASGVLVDAGATAYGSNREVAAESDVIITMLPDSPDVKEVVWGEDGVLAGIRSGSLFVDMSTIAPSTAREVYAALQEKGVEALDAPVSGGQKGAEDGAVSIMVGGDQKAFDRAKPLFDIMGKSAVLGAEDLLAKAQKIAEGADQRFEVFEQGVGSVCLSTRNYPDTDRYTFSSEDFGDGTVEAAARRVLGRLRDAGIKVPPYSAEELADYGTVKLS